MRYVPFLLCCGLFGLSLVSPAVAVMSGYQSPSTAPRDQDYAAGLEAFEGQDWQGVIDHMSRVITRRPWDDNAYTFMGYAYRKLGNYPQALAHYRQGLDLNPYHRGALEYLGKTYVAMGCMDQARAMLARLEAVCRRTGAAAAAADGQPDCEEWHTLQAAIDKHTAVAAATGTCADN